MAVNRAYFCQNDLSEDELYVNMRDSVAGMAKFDCEFVYKEPTSFYNPVLIIEHDFLATANCNYVAIYFGDIDDYRYFFIEDVITTSFNICEVSCKFDAFRTVPWRNMGTKIQLRYSNRENHWSTTCDEPRFMPYAPQGEWEAQTRGMRRVICNTRIHAQESNVSDVDTGNTSTTYGVYLVKWWWGSQDGEYGIVYGAFGHEQYSWFMAAVSRFVADNPGAILSGISDFTKFIISARYFPSIRLKDFENAGYVSKTGLGVGGLATVNATCLLKHDSAGFLRYSGDFADNKGALFPLGPSGIDSEDNKLKKLKFLLQRKWCKLIVDTPVGVGEIPLDCIGVDGQYTAGFAPTNIDVNEFIDLESGTMTMNFCTNYIGTGWNGSSNLLLQLKGPISFDVSNQFMHVTTDGEALIQGMINGGASAVAGGMMAGPVGAAAGFVGGAIAGLAAPRNINYPVSGYNDIKYLASWDFSLAKYSVTSMIFLNPDTPIWDSQTYSLSTTWNAQNVYTRYTNWCKELYHGFPSIQYITCSGIGPGVSDTSWYIQAEKILDINVYDYPHWCEDIIKDKLLKGVVLKYYNLT